MAFNIDDFFSRFNAARTSPLPEDDPLRVVAGILEELFAEGFAAAGVASLAETAAGTENLVRAIRSEMTQEMRGLQSEVRDLRKRVGDLQRQVEIIPQRVSDLTPKKQRWFFGD